MDFNKFLNKSWNDHTTQPLLVAEKVSDGFKFINQENQISQMAQLITHVFGEHLGQWDDGIETLQKLRQLPVYTIGEEGDKAIIRAITSLEVSAGKKSKIDDLSNSDQIRVLTTSASALCEQKNAVKAQELFRNALELAQYGISKDDPANRALAVSGNNLACALEEKSSRNSAETELMILAAQTGRKYWEITGTWLEVERAEYRLAMTYLKAGNTVHALEHALECLKIIHENNAPALEFFFGYEVLALSEKDRGNNLGLSKALENVKLYFAKLSDDDKSWCNSHLTNLEN